MASGIQIPDELGPPNRGGYEDTYEETRSDVPMDIGPSRMRQLFSVTPRLFNVSWEWTPLQYGIFEQWWQESIGAGIAEFDIQLLDNNEILKWFTCTFAEGKFSANITRGQVWNVSARLRTIEPSFAVRLPTTDKLNGRANLKFVRARGYLPRPVQMYGAASFGPKVRSAFLPPVEMSGRAKLGVRDAYGELE